MSTFSTTVLIKLMLLGLVSFALLLTVSGVYTGPRYGKRLPYGEVSRVALRSSSPRTIQSRSQVRFYAGSRYGGKRSYWDTSMPDSETAEYLQQQQQLAGYNAPYDCFYIPFVGVRCATRHTENAWNGVGESDDDSGNPTMNGSPLSSASVVGSDAS